MEYDDSHDAGSESFSESHETTNELTCVNDENESSEDSLRKYEDSADREWSEYPEGCKEKERDEHVALSEQDYISTKQVKNFTNELEEFLYDVLRWPSGGEAISILETVFSFLIITVDDGHNAEDRPPLCDLEPMPRSLNIHFPRTSKSYKHITFWVKRSVDKKWHVYCGVRHVLLDQARESAQACKINMCSCCENRTSIRIYLRPNTEYDVKYSLYHSIDEQASWTRASEVSTAKTLPDTSECPVPHCALHKNLYGKYGGVGLLDHFLETGGDVNFIHQQVGKPPCSLLVHAMLPFHAGENSNLCKLLKAGADPNIILLDSNGEQRTPLQAAFFPPTQLEEFLSQKFVDEEEWRDNVEEKRVECLNLFLKHGVDLNMHLGGGNTLLHDACRSVAISSVKLMLEHGADWNATDEEGKTPLDAVRDLPDTEIGSLERDILVNLLENANSKL